jgi:hypothetical protein
MGQTDEAAEALPLTPQSAQALVKTLRSWLGERADFIRTDPLVLPGDQRPLTLEVPGRSIVLTPRETLDLMQSLEGLLTEQLLGPNAHDHIYSDDYQTSLAVWITNEGGLGLGEISVRA